MQNPTTVNLAATTVFTLTVDDGTCQATDDITVTVTGGPLLVTASATPATICAGESVTLNAVGSGGDGKNYTYSWDNGAGTIQSPTVTPTVTTTYEVTITDGNLDTSTDQVTVTVNSLPIVFNLGPDPVVVCWGTDAIINLYGSELNVTYTLLRNGTSVGSLSPIAGTGNSLTIILPQSAFSNGDEWTLRAETAAGCTAIMAGQAEIQISDPAVYTISTDPVLTVCQGQDATITLDNSDTGVTYALLNAGNPVTSLPGTGTSLDFVLTDGNFADGEVYTVEADNSSCQVAMTGSVEIDLVELDATFSYASATFCFDGADPLPEPGYATGGTFSTTDPVVVDPDNGTIDVSASTVGGPYTITYTIGSGSCIATETFEVSITNTTADPTFSYSATEYCVQPGNTVPIFRSGYQRR